MAISKHSFALSEYNEAFKKLELLQVDVHQNEGANLLVDKLRGHLKDAEAALLKVEDNVNVVDAMHIEELKNTVDKLSLTLQTLQVVVEEKAPVDAMDSALKERYFTQEVEEKYGRQIITDTPNIAMANPFTEVKFVGGKKCGDQDSKVLGHAEKEDVLDKEAEPDAEVEIVGGYNCEEQDPSVEVHVEKEGVLEKDNAATSNIDNLAHIISMIAKSTMKDPPDVDTSFRVEGQVPCASNIEDQEDKNTKFFVLNTSEDTKIIIKKFESPQETGDAFVEVGGDATCAGGAGGAHEDTAKPPQKNGDASVDASVDASCKGGAGGVVDASATKYVRHDDGTVTHPLEDGADARGVASYVRNNSGMVSRPWEDPRNIQFESKPTIFLDINGVLLTSIDKRHYSQMPAY
ncbi:hypothetical protein L7F22_052379 [Adiantum nelumboides]|nr:hypothetical protein [Adiantum nelumboides]